MNLGVALTQAHALTKFRSKHQLRGRERRERRVTFSGAMEGKSEMQASGFLCLRQDGAPVGSLASKRTGKCRIRKSADGYRPKG